MQPPEGGPQAAGCTEPAFGRLRQFRERIIQPLHSAMQGVLERRVEGRAARGASLSNGRLVGTRYFFLGSSAGFT
jgi:hypothetical protein